MPYGCLLKYNDKPKWNWSFNDNSSIPINNTIYVFI